MTTEQEIEKIYKHLRHSKIAVYAIVVFLVLLTFLLVKTFSQVATDERAFTYQSEAQDVEGEPGFDDMCIAVGKLAGQPINFEKKEICSISCDGGRTYPINLRSYPIGYDQSTCNVLAKLQCKCHTTSQQPIPTPTPTGNPICPGGRCPTQAWITPTRMPTSHIWPTSVQPSPTGPPSWPWPTATGMPIY